MGWNKRIKSGVAGWDPCSARKAKSLIRDCRQSCMCSLTNSTTVHPSIIYNCSCFAGSWGAAPDPNWHWAKSHQFVTGLAHRHLFTPLESSIILLTCMSLYCGRKWEHNHTHTHRDNMQTPHRKGPCPCHREVPTGARTFLLWGDSDNNCTHVK